MNYIQQMQYSNGKKNSDLQVHRLQWYTDEP